MSTFDRYAPFIQDFIYEHDWQSLRSVSAVMLRLRCLVGSLDFRTVGLRDAAERRRERLMLF